MSVVTYKENKQISSHFNSKEFRCPHCGVMRISVDLVNKVEDLFAYVNASKCIVSSGYRCSYYDKLMNGFAGRHSEGLAMDCCFYDKGGRIIPSKIICCVAYDLGFPGVSYIDSNYVHLDLRSNGTYRGDESRGNSSYWTNPYSYFKVDVDDVLKYTKNNVHNNKKLKYQSHGLNTKWYPNVIFNDNDYVGVFGVSMDGIYIDDLKYRVRVNGKWLPEVVGRNDYAGILGKVITDVAIKGDVMYRVHNKTYAYWLDWVDGNNYNIYDKEYGYAGNGSIIDAIEIKKK